MDWNGRRGAACRSSDSDAPSQQAQEHSRRVAPTDARLHTFLGASAAVGLAPAELLASGPRRFVALPLRAWGCQCAPSRKSHAIYALHCGSVDRARAAGSEPQRERMALRKAFVDVVVRVKSRVILCCLRLQQLGLPPCADHKRNIRHARYARHRNQLSPVSWPQLPVRYTPAALPRVHRRSRPESPAVITHWTSSRSAEGMGSHDLGKRRDGFPRNIFERLAARSMEPIRLCFLPAKGKHFANRCTRLS